jgi:hypothetical protein
MGRAAAGWTAKQVVPVERIELPTFGLQNRCSTAELNRPCRFFSGNVAWFEEAIGPLEGRFSRHNRFAILCPGHFVEHPANGGGVIWLLQKGAAFRQLTVANCMMTRGRNNLDWGPAAPNGRR